MSAQSRAIVLNGGSSSGKSSIARLLKERLKGRWLSFGIDDLIQAMPYRDLNDGDGLTISPSGKVDVGGAFRAYEQAWMCGLQAVAERQVGLILEDVFISGPTAQQRWKENLCGSDILWVGVMCLPNVAEQRELARGDRQKGMARLQAESVHAGIEYDMVVDTTSASTGNCVDLIVMEAERRWRSGR
ncbi:hypothetical protein AAC691_03520 [Nguyenibacter vanlangensis]|uniref:Chloramphenicol 3-O phosphotransferase n=1 Tax=Nguyenibacter vanlangensis TaxID=1216886 RepID=A0ABZ3D703_9PROT